MFARFWLVDLPFDLFPSLFGTLQFVFVCVPVFIHVPYGSTMTYLLVIVSLAIYLPIFFAVPSAIVGSVFYFITGYFQIPFFLTFALLFFWMVFGFFLALRG